MRRKLFRLLVLTAFLLPACAGDETTEQSSTTEASTSTAPKATTTTTEPTTTEPPTTTTTALTTTTEPKPELTQDFAAASLSEVTQRLFDAWASGADDLYPAIDQEIRTVVIDVLESHGPISEVAGWQEEYLRLRREGIDEFSDGDYFPEGTFTRLAVIGVPESPVTLFTGVYKIGDAWTGTSGGHSGDETTIPGTYVVLDVEDCYWETLDSAGAITDNNFVSAAPRVEAIIRSSDFAFNSEGCGRWVRVGG